jgi:hypothetical protein
VSGGLLGILVALAGLVWLSFRGWSVLVLAPAAALVAAAAAGEPLPSPPVMRPRQRLAVSLSTTAAVLMAAILLGAGLYFLLVSRLQIPEFQELSQKLFARFPFSAFRKNY